MSKKVVHKISTKRNIPGLTSGAHIHIYSNSALIQLFQMTHLMLASQTEWLLQAWQEHERENEFSL